MFVTSSYNFQLHNLIPQILTFKIKKNCSITLTSSKDMLIKVLSKSESVQKFN